MVHMATVKISRLRFGMAPMLMVFALLLVSLFFMGDATHNSERFGWLYSWLLLINAGALIILGALVVANIIWLIKQRRNKTVGAQLTSRLVVMFVILATVPVCVVYYFSLQSLQRGIDSWFDIRVQESLDDALELSRAALDVRLRDALNVTEQIADDLSAAPFATMALNLYDFRVRSGASELTLLGADARIIASSSVDMTSIVPPIPADEMLLAMRSSGYYIGLDPVGDAGLYARALVPVLSSRQDSEVFTLQALFPVSERMSALADSVQSTYARYKELSYLRKLLKFQYTLTLSMVLVLSLLAAIWAAFYSARRLVAPISDLAEATRAVASGDYSQRLPVASEDELGFLVRSFNDMTRRLAKARDQAQKNKQQVDGQRAYLEAVLANLSSGVISLDTDTGIRAVNAAASKHLGTDLKSFLGRQLDAISKEHATLKPFIDAINRHRGREDKAWKEEVSLFGAGGRQVLMCRGTFLQGTGSRGAGQVIVFDDITTLIQAERDAAWGEVARRLAHEIKNPLTPIQLSAERLRRRYLDQQKTDDMEMLDRATKTIVNQVESMKKMVNAFSEYARTPKINLESLDLNTLVGEVLELYRGHGIHARIDRQFDAELPLIEGDAGRLRQLLHNLLKNALDAVAGKADAVVSVSTTLRENEGGRFAELVVEDNGPGFEPGVMENVFEPYVSTKPKGSGLGLAIVKKIIEEHGGAIFAEQSDSGGARVRMQLQLEQQIQA